MTSPRGGGPYKVRQVRTGNPRAHKPSYQITIPAEIAERIPESAQFNAELVEDGILLRLAYRSEPTPLPEWVKP
jgi:hypothetical protein